MPRPIPPQSELDSPPVMLGACGCGCDGEICLAGTGVNPEGIYETIGFTTQVMEEETSQILTIDTRNEDLPCLDKFFHWECDYGTIGIFPPPEPEDPDADEIGTPITYTTPSIGSGHPTDQIRLYAKHPEHPETWKGVLCATLNIVVITAACTCSGTEDIEVLEYLEPGYGYFKLKVLNRHPTDPCDLEYSWLVWDHDLPAGYEPYFYSPSGYEVQLYPGPEHPNVQGSAEIALYCLGVFVKFVIVEWEGCLCSGEEEVLLDGTPEDRTIDINTDYALSYQYGGIPPCDQLVKFVLDQSDGSQPTTAYLIRAGEENIPANRVWTAYGATATLYTGASEGEELRVRIYCNEVRTDRIILTVDHPSDCNCSYEEWIDGNWQDGGEFQALPRLIPGTEIDLDVRGYDITNPCGADSGYSWSLSGPPTLLADLEFDTDVGRNVSLRSGGLTTGECIIHLLCKDLEVAYVTLFVSDCYCNEEFTYLTKPTQMDRNSAANAMILSGMSPEYPCDQTEAAAYTWAITNNPGGCSIDPEEGRTIVIRSGGTDGTLSIRLRCHGVSLGIFNVTVIDCTCSAEIIRTVDTQETTNQIIAVDSSLDLEVSSQDPSYPCGDADYVWIRDNPTVGHVSPSFGETTTFYSDGEVGSCIVTLKCKGAVTDTMTIRCDYVCAGNESIDYSSVYMNTGESQYLEVIGAGGDEYAYQFELYDLPPSNKHYFMDPTSGVGTRVRVIAGVNLNCMYPIKVRLRCNGVIVPDSEIQIAVGNATENSDLKLIRRNYRCSYSTSVDNESIVGHFTNVLCDILCICSYEYVACDGSTGVRSFSHWYTNAIRCSAQAASAKALSCCADGCGGAGQTTPGSPREWEEYRDLDTIIRGCCPSEWYPYGVPNPPNTPFDNTFRLIIRPNLISSSSYASDLQLGNDNNWQTCAYSSSFAEGQWFAYHFVLPNWSAKCQIVKKLVRHRVNTWIGGSVNCYSGQIRQYSSSSGWSGYLKEFQWTGGMTFTRTYEDTQDDHWGNQYVRFTNILSSPSYRFEIYECEMEVFYTCSE